MNSTNIIAAIAIAGIALFILPFIMCHSPNEIELEEKEESE
jgi:hypothetical protein